MNKVSLTDGWWLRELHSLPHKSLDLYLSDELRTRIGDQLWSPLEVHLGSSLNIQLRDKFVKDFPNE